MPKSTASNSRSNQNITPAVPRETRLSGGAGLFERRDHVAGFVCVRRDHDLLAGLAELLGVLVRHAPELRLHDAGVGPFSILVEADRADDGTHLILAQVSGELFVVEALGTVHRLLQHLPDGVVERRKVEAEW